MKKLLSAILALACLCFFVACNQEKNGLVFKTFEFEENTTRLVLPNETEHFSFLDEIETKGKTKYAVTLDEYGMQTVMTKTVPLAVGNNTFYVVELLDGEAQKLYTVAIRRRPIYTVSFDDKYMEEPIPTQEIEEGGFAKKPSSIPKWIGYVFDGWDCNFIEPVMQNMMIEAKWTMEESFADFEFDSTMNSCVITSTKDQNKSEIVIPEGVTEIGKSAFQKYSGLKNVKIASSVTYINQWAFNDCHDLTSIVIPSSVTRISDYAFNACDGLTTVYYTGTESEWERMPIDSSNEALVHATRYYYSETEPTEDGNYWYYGENGEILVWETAQV